MVNNEATVQIMPYSMIVGQEQLKLALELAYIAPRIGGVLLSGHRGTGKSTAVRAFARMMDDNGRLPVTLPINATEDRVVGGWKIDALMQSKAEPEPGLLEEANGRILYIDEVNLLDDHIVNIILDVTATGILVVQREGRRDEKKVSFTLVGTMNPEEGGLRLQLLDRFGLMVNITAETDNDKRRQILETVLQFDEAQFLQIQNKSASRLKKAYQEDEAHKKKLLSAKGQFYDVQVPRDITDRCVKIAKELQAEGHRGDYIMALAARACAARDGRKQVTVEYVRQVAPLALQHRRPQVVQSEGQILWGKTENDIVDRYLGNA